MSWVNTLRRRSKSRTLYVKRAYHDRYKSVPEEGRKHCCVIDGAIMAIIVAYKAEKRLLKKYLQLCGGVLR
jgi:hypothetical protein